MDIFTTQLTRVVPVPIKPTNLKVKALLKEAATGKLKDDPDHLENHEYYFISGAEEDENKPQHQAQSKDDNNTATESDKEEESVITEDKDHKPHLDIFV
ncbi:MAG: hypothetical protein MJK12_20420 [Colwellia sp.]|nr:hypothetical protein [Colwellia sp.]